MEPIFKDRRKKWKYEIVRRGSNEFFPVPYYTYHRFSKSVFNVGGITDPAWKEKYLCLDCSETFFNMIVRGEL